MHLTLVPGLSDIPNQALAHTNTGKLYDISVLDDIILVGYKQAILARVPLGANHT